jgi:hypothetical protein
VECRQWQVSSAEARFRKRGVHVGEFQLSQHPAKLAQRAGNSRTVGVDDKNILLEPKNSY